MNKFKVGDEIWFFWHHNHSEFWGDDDNLIYPSGLDIQKAKIILIDPEKDRIHAYVHGSRYLCQFGECFHQNYFFHTKDEAIDSMIKKLESIKD